MRIELPSGAAAELATPTTGEPTAGLVVIPDVGGLRPLFDELVQRLADEQGWTVVAPDPFAGWAGDPLTTLPDRMAAVATLTDDRVLGDVVAAADATGFDDVGLIGFCMGGMYTLKAAGTGRFRRAAAFYGFVKVPDYWQAPGHGEPLDALRAPDATPVLAVVAGQDSFVPVEDVPELEAAGVTVALYPDAEHGFVHDAARDTHRPDDAADAWARVIDFLRS